MQGKMVALEIKAVFLLSLSLLSLGAKATSHRDLVGTGVAVFDVTKFEANPNGRIDSTLQIMRAWRAACASTGPAKLLIPQGTFATGKLVFGPPCTAPKPITIEIQGTLVARSSSLELFDEGYWITVEHIDGVVITGPGTLNARGEAVWKYKSKGSSSMLPNSIVFQSVTNSAIKNVQMKNSMGFHMKISDCSSFRAENLHITAPGNSPNTDGIHVSGSTNVNITNNVIGTGDDCVSIGDSNNNIFVNKITCGPGHGISIGSLGKRGNEKSVKGVRVTNCTLTGTTNGARIKTYRQSPALEASSITFEDIVMNGVKNPIIIDQNYASRGRKGGSRVKISDVHFKNIRGTTISPVAVELSCSDVVPCQGVELVDIDLSFTTDTRLISQALGQAFKVVAGEFMSACTNAKAAFLGKQNPAACK